MPIDNVAQLGFLVTGTVREHDGEGFQRITYQRVLKGMGNIPLPSSDRYDLSRYAYRNPGNPKTPAQIYRQTLMAQAHAAWQGFNDQQRQEWKERGKARGLPGYHTWISYYLRTAPPFVE